MMREKLFIIIFILFSGVTIGQINEAGAFLGGSNYIGDIGSTRWIYPNSFAVGAVYKWNMHPRYSIRANYTYSKIKGDDAQSNNSFRVYRDLNFGNSVHELVAGIEYHFFKYNLSQIGYTNTPYILLQAGVVNYGTFEEGRTYNFVMPIGVGYKMKLAQGIGIGFETSFRYTFKDDIDGYPFDQDGANVQINPNDNDWYVFTGITLVFAFGREGCYTGKF